MPDCTPRDNEEGEMKEKEAEAIEDGSRDFRKKLSASLAPSSVVPASPSHPLRSSAY